MNIANLAKDHPGCYQANARDGQDDGAESFHNGFYFGFDIADLTIQ